MSKFVGVPFEIENETDVVDGDGDLVCHVETAFRYEDDRAIARLFSTAPDLLEACERARSHLYQAGYEPKENSLNPNEEMLFQLNAAISKARAE